ncbi:MAG: hypothetical protein HY051_00720 [Candidatus Aenigmarchaeota archaeon]|nr:hypothetical protein [Candidatus Aenigmarchaeota archaeon]
MANINPTAQGGRIARQDLLGQLYDHTVGWVLDHKLASTAAAIAAAGTIAAATLLSPSGSAREAVNANTDSRPAVVQTASSQSQTASEIYYSQVRASLLQDVPELANYQRALEYTIQRMVDKKNVYEMTISRGVNPNEAHMVGGKFEQIKQPLVKWLRANIEWDKRGERLIPFTEETDFIPNAMFGGNLTANPEANDISNVMKKTGIKNPSAAAFTSYVDELIAKHDQIWAELQDPAKLEEYLNQADIVNFWWTKQEAAKYKSAIRQHGTFEDKAHWALVGKAYAKPMGNEELTRNEQPLAYILAVGGGAQISYNFTVTLSTGGSRGDRQLAIRISKQLQDAINADPATYGHPIDSEYLQPNLPNRESVDKTLEPDGKIAMPVVYRRSGSKITWLVGDEATARRYDLN